MLDKKEKEKLFQAAKNSDLETVKSFIEGVDGHPELLLDEDGRTVVHLAARKGCLDLVKYMLEDKPALNYTCTLHKNLNNLNMLDDAIFGGVLEIVEYLLKKYNVTMSAENDCDRILYTTITYDRLDILKYFIEKEDIDVNEPCGKNSEPLLFGAFRYKRPDIIKYLVEERNADLKKLNYVDDNLLFPLAETGDLDSMKHLLDEKKLEFDINQEDLLGKTVLFVATASNRTNIVKYLVDEKEANVNIPEYAKFNSTCLHQAVTQNNYEICEYLIQHGANVEDKNTYDKIKDVRISQLLERDSVPARRRRSVNQQLPSIPKSRQYEYPKRNLFGTMKHLSTSSKIATTFVKSENVLHQFQNLLWFTQLAMRKGKSESFNEYSSPQQILQDRMDPIAESAIHNILNFN